MASAKGRSRGDRGSLRSLQNREESGEESRKKRGEFYVMSDPSPDSDSSSRSFGI